MSGAPRSAPGVGAGGTARAAAEIRLDGRVWYYGPEGRIEGPTDRSWNERRPALVEFAVHAPEPQPVRLRFEFEQPYGNGQKATVLAVGPRALPLVLTAGKDSIPAAGDTLERTLRKQG